MADMVMVENNEVAANVEQQESPAAIRLFKKAGAVAIGALAVYGVVSLVKDGITAVKEIGKAGGMKAYMAQKEFKKEAAKETKEKN